MNQRLSRRKSLNLIWLRVGGWRRSEEDFHFLLFLIKRRKAGYFFRMKKYCFKPNLSHCEIPKIQVIKLHVRTLIVIRQKFNLGLRSENIEFCKLGDWIFPNFCVGGHFLNSILSLLRPKSIFCMTSNFGLVPRI